MVNKRVQNAVLGCNLKNDRMISVRFQGKPFNITVIQVYALTSNTEVAEAEQFYSRAAPGKSGLYARGEGERVLALESREGTRASRRVEEGLSRSLSGGGRPDYWNG